MRPYPKANIFALYHVADTSLQEVEGNTAMHLAAFASNFAMVLAFSLPFSCLLPVVLPLFLWLHAFACALRCDPDPPCYQVKTLVQFGADPLITNKEGKMSDTLTTFKAKVRGQHAARFKPKPIRRMSRLYRALWWRCKRKSLRPSRRASRSGRAT
jgi:ankyrin repeat protein